MTCMFSLFNVQQQKHQHPKMLSICPILVQTPCFFGPIDYRNRMSLQTSSKRMLLFMLQATCWTNHSRGTAVVNAKIFWYQMILMMIERFFAISKHTRRKILVVWTCLLEITWNTFANWKMLLSLAFLLQPRIQKLPWIYLKSPMQSKKLMYDCADFPYDYLLKFLVPMRIYYRIKFANGDFSTKKKSRKYIKKPHLSNH